MSRRSAGSSFIADLRWDDHYPIPAPVRLWSPADHQGVDQVVARARFPSCRRVKGIINAPLVYHNEGATPDSRIIERRKARNGANLPGRVQRYAGSGGTRAAVKQRRAWAAYAPMPGASRLHPLISNLLVDTLNPVHMEFSRPPCEGDQPEPAHSSVVPPAGRTPRHDWHNRHHHA